MASENAICYHRSEDLRAGQEGASGTGDVRLVRVDEEVFLGVSCLRGAHKKLEGSFPCGDMFDVYQVSTRVKRHLTLDEESITDRMKQEKLAMPLITPKKSVHSACSRSMALSSTFREIALMVLNQSFFS